jgi:hypothetical protein
MIDEEMILIDEVPDEALEAAAGLALGGFPTLPHTYCFASPSDPPQELVGTSGWKGEPGQCSRHDPSQAATSKPTRNLTQVNVGPASKGFTVIAHLQVLLLT